MHSSTSHARHAAISVLVLAIAISTGAVSSFAKGAPLPLPAYVVYQFPNPTWIENLAVRENGQILVTLLTTPDLYLIDPFFQTATLVHSFPSVLGLSAITEVELDLFYVVGGNLSLALLKNTPGTYSVWEVDMRFYPLFGASVRKVTDIPQAGFLNGGVTLSSFPTPSETILLADSALGGVWEVNVQTGAYFFAIYQPASMNPVLTATFNFVGVDGVKIHNGYLYYTNFNQGVFYRISINGAGAATGSAQALAVGSPSGVDDFAFDGQGRPWIAENFVNEVGVLLGNGTLVTAVGATDQLTVAGVTSCAFGRLLFTTDLLYCTTSGAMLNPVNGTKTEGGKLVVINTAEFSVY